jgi:hypothetical protein
MPQMRWAIEIFYYAFFSITIVYYVMRSKNEVLCAAAGRLAAERSEADKPAKAHKTIFAPNNIQGLPELADQNNTVKSLSSGNNRKNI